MVVIYILQLEKGKYYIGKTNNPNFRIENHFYGDGSEWTKIYKPVKVIDIIKDCDDYDEDKYTRIYMDKYGINNVRGGSFVSIKLKKSEIEILKKMSTGTNNRCFICETAGHFAKDCPENWETDEEWETDNDDDSDIDNEIQYKLQEQIYKSKKPVYTHFQKQPQISNYNKNCCYRCGRPGHFSNICYATTHINGYYIR